MISQEVSVPDLFFAHDRGTSMGIYAFLLFGSHFLAPYVKSIFSTGLFHSVLTINRLFAGWIDVYNGWRWVM
jgi:hypothetical protein